MFSVKEIPNEIVNKQFIPKDDYFFIPIMSVWVTEKNEKVVSFIKENITPTYIDTTYEENLYKCSLIEDLAANKKNKKKLGAKNFKILENLHHQCEQDEYIYIRFISD